MGIANYTNLSEIMNARLEKGHIVSISDLVLEAQAKNVILASEGELADKSDLENGFIELVNVLFRSGDIKPHPAGERESRLVQLFESGELARNGYGGDEGDRFLEIKWSARADQLPVITNINL